jgi:hypothetical protein
MRAVTVLSKLSAVVIGAAQLGEDVVGQQQRRARRLVVAAETVIAVPPAHRAAAVGTAR